MNGNRFAAAHLAYLVVLVVCAPQRLSAAPVWNGYAADPQHSALSTVPSQPLTKIIWQTPVDLQPQYSGSNLLIHYGSPSVTQAGTVVVPVKTGAAGGFQVEGHRGSDGALLWTQSSTYQLPSHNWTPSFGPTLTPSNRLYMPGPGGTVLYRDDPDSASSTTGQLAFYQQLGSYNSATFDGTVFINTPITSNANGDIYFGYRTQGTAPLGLQSGIARIDSAGNGTFQSIASLGVTGTRVAMNSAPALSIDGNSLYLAVNSGSFSSGSLLKLNSSSLALQSSVLLKDPRSGGVNNAIVPDDGTASPTVGPDGSVYFGVLEGPFTSSRGWLLQFSGNLAPQSAPGAFGWDDTASIVPASMVPSYLGASTYLLMTKYNNYAGYGGGDGVNKLAILDPNDTMPDPHGSGVTVMKEVLTIAGVTPDADHTGSFPHAVREWCINTAVVDPATNSVLVNNEDGKLYRWDLSTNSFTQVITLTAGLGEAYTPTLIGADGKVYAVNNAILFAVGVPEPSSAHLAIGFLVMLRRRKPSPQVADIVFSV